MKRIKCFIIEDMHVTRYFLRRYSSSDDGKCSGGSSYHNAMSPAIEDRPDTDQVHSGTNPPEMPPHEDPRWPIKCEKCNYLFVERDHWQVFAEGLYRHSETGEVFELDKAPPGAMWDATWWPTKGPDGKVLTVKLPDGVDWMVDGPSGGKSDGKPWTRSGTPPEITANLSILTPGYHGFLRNGYLEEC